MTGAVGQTERLNSGPSQYSFPSGEFASITSAVTPFVRDCGVEYPAVYGLELQPLYDALGHPSSFAAGTSPGEVTICWQTKF